MVPCGGACPHRMIVLKGAIVVGPFSPQTPFFLNSLILVAYARAPKFNSTIEHSALNLIFTNINSALSPRLVKYKG
jgi:hypothetical protein